MSATALGDHDRVDARPRRRRLPSGLLRLASDERLVELLRGGSEAAFEALYARHHRGVLSFSRHMLGSAEEAEDAVQHTFLAAYRDMAGSSKEIQLRPWLYAIARNRCLTVLRARREQVGAEPPEPSTEHLSTEVERRHELQALLGDLAGLPDDQRAALVLAELGDMSHDEVAQALDCPREKVKALVFQARSSLIASREAREASCDDIREQLANLRGGALRRNVLRRHVRECAGCREFRDKVRQQRRELALILPVAPSLGLQAAVLGGGAAATSAVVAKTAIVLVVAGGGVAAVEEVREKERAARPAVTKPRAPAAAPTGEAAGNEPPTAVPASDAVLGREDVRPADHARDRHDRPQGTARRAAEARRRAAGRGRARGHSKADERGPGLVPGSSDEQSEARAAEPAEQPKAVKVKPVRVKPARPEKPAPPPKPEKQPKVQAAPPPESAPPAPAAPPAEAAPPAGAAPPADSSPPAAATEKTPKADKNTD